MLNCIFSFPFFNPKSKNMIELLFSVICGEMVLILALLFKTPFRRLVIMGLDWVKRGRGPVMVKTVSGTVFIVLLSTIQGMATMQDNALEGGLVNPTDQVLMARHMLEASLMGFLLFLALMLDRLHHYIRELRLLRKTIQNGMKRSYSFDDGRDGNEAKDVAAKELSELKRKIKQLETKAEHVKASDPNAKTLKAQDG